MGFLPYPDDPDALLPEEPAIFDIDITGYNNAWINYTVFETYPPPFPEVEPIDANAASKPWTVYVSGKRAVRQLFYYRIFLSELRNEFRFYYGGQMGFWADWTPEIFPTSDKGYWELVDVSHSLDRYEVAEGAWYNADGNIWAISSPPITHIEDRINRGAYILTTMEWHWNAFPPFVPSLPLTLLILPMMLTGGTPLRRRHNG